MYHKQKIYKKFTHEIPHSGTFFTPNVGAFAPLPPGLAAYAYTVKTLGFPSVAARGKQRFALSVKL